ncbi:hypothetical protein P775_16700 [Puniceibacterium antarcticum]|uniref:Uncharacterized protein n=1 Tax=Puniceibacterium antarcticum TaxID=1206336 RepID=A0A2G8RBU1_9RHOB|nr:hypothetical protein P775_16700 [Puniceibacterium antarcticum]
MRITELAKDLANRVGVRVQAGRVMSGGRQFRHRDVAVLGDDFREDGSVRITFAFASGASLGRGSRPSCAPN